MNAKLLKPFLPRQFLEPLADLSDLATVKSYFKILDDRPISSLQDLEKWLLDRSELEAALSQAGSILYIEMTCHTDDLSKTRAYAAFIETVMPVVKPLADQLNRKCVKAAKMLNLPQERYGLYLKALTTDIELFVDINVPLQTQVDLLAQEYQKVSGAMTVQFQGQELTMPQMAKFQLDNDRTVREDAWAKSAHRRLQDKDVVESIFERMFRLRCDIARNAGFNTFTEYQFKAYHRFDYGPQDCMKYHESIEKHIVPLYGQILDQRKKELKVGTLKPWDLAVDPLKRKPLKPFEHVDELKEGVQRIFDKLDKDLSKEFKTMGDLGLLDLASRKGKAPGGYQNTLAEARLPFIFMNAVGVDDDVRTLLHEAGHAFHAMASAHEPLLDYRHAPMEFCEVASMAMELVGSRFMSVFYSKSDAVRSHREHLEGIIHTLAWVATIDKFQHWLYSHPNHTSQERRQAWVGFYQQFGGQFIDWTGQEEARSYLWHRQLHVFEVPFYYIEYGIAQLGALQWWLKSQHDFKQALSLYRQGLSLGGSKPLPALYEATGITFDFSEDTIQPLAQTVFEHWRSLIV